MKAELITNSGDDLLVVNAARVSFDKESEWEYDGHGFYEDDAPSLSQKDEKLINYLATHNHYTPFAHPQITLRETIPIFVARQRFKHVVGFTYNEISRRYVSDEPEFFMPNVWRKAPENKKQGSGENFPFEKDLTEDTFSLATNEELSERIEDLHAFALQIYKYYLSVGMAPEQARMVLPQSMYTSYYVTGSLAAFARAYKLRSQPDAQLEIQELAKEWDRIIRPLYPVSWSALVD